MKSVPLPLLLFQVNAEEPEAGRCGAAASRCGLLSQLRRIPPAASSSSPGVVVIVGEAGAGSGHGGVPVTFPITGTGNSTVYYGSTGSGHVMGG